MRPHAPHVNVIWMKDFFHSESALAAVIVTHEPSLATLSEQLRRLQGQVELVMVIDNGSHACADVAEIVSEHAFAQFIGAPDNQGLGWAQNEGLSRVLDLGAQAVLILDQDSLPRPGMVTALHRALQRQREDGIQTGAVGSRYLGSDLGHPSYFVQFAGLNFRRCYCSENQKALIPADMLISSGALFSREALEAVGLMEADLFIDHLDTEWFLRAGAKGWSSYGVCDAVMEHGLGERTARFWLGRWRYLPVHRPFRYYYIYRNSMLLWRRPYPSKRWKRTDVLRLVKMFLIFALFVGERSNNIRMMMRGIRDGIRGRSGRLDVSLK